ncbi:MAG: LuxR C-terminal-related transcriptional regulator [Geobacteraceae bacterium]|nr:LuxR C-terminal-related transcriptional regulator [Geobacteraceae bacterium]
MSEQESPELISCLSGNDAIKLLEVIQSSLDCNSEADFSALVTKIRELFPFDFAGVLLGNHDDSRGLMLAYGLNISFPEEWLREYLSNNYFSIDFATRETFRTYNINHLSYLTTPNVKAVVPKEVMSLNMDFGAREGYFHGSPPQAPGKHGSGFIFAGHLIQQNRRTEAILKILVHHLHLALCHIFHSSPSNVNRPVLSSREKEVLNWLKHGKSSWEMSIILGISERTVNYHIYNIMAKLDTTNRPQAVAVATRLGLIELD